MPPIETKITSPSKGFETLDDEVQVGELPLEGNLPAWLSGSLIRNGPAKFEVGEQRMRHWFDGYGMLHRFSFAEGRVSYANRYIQSRNYAEARRQGKIAYSEFAMSGPLLARPVALFARGDTGQRQHQRRRARRADDRDDRDPDPNRIRP